MKTRSLVFFLCAAPLFFSACDSNGITGRIEEKAVVFNQLEPWQQRDIRNGVVNVGHSTDMVYMALGRPTKIVTTADGAETTWTYSNYYPPESAPHSQLNLETKGGAGYSSSTSGVNSPGGGVSLGSTSTRGGTQTSLSVGEIPADTLYVIFKGGQVVRTKLESETK
ncbi:MAG: hypothetical protein JWM35_646 [Verrucomicrobia bacterium]|nr:hypothetical protein [Verrucomicrobiota bacterium]